MNMYEWAGIMVLFLALLVWIGLALLVYLFFGGNWIEAGIAGFGLLYLVYWGIISANERRQ